MKTDWAVHFTNIHMLEKKYLNLIKSCKIQNAFNSSFEFPHCIIKKNKLPHSNWRLYIIPSTFLPFFSKHFPLRVRLIRELGGEGREGKGKDFNGGEGREDILIKNVFGSQGEGREGGVILKLFYCFTLKLN